TEVESEGNTEKDSLNNDTLNVALVTEIDDHTLSNYMDARTKHLHLDIAVSFENKQITGTATHTIENITGTDHIDFDTKALNIIGVTLNDGTPAEFTLGEFDALLGTKLTVKIDANTE